MALQETNFTPEQMWNVLEGSLKVVLNKKRDKISYKKFCGHSYRMVSMNAGDLLYKNIQYRFSKYFRNETLPIILNAIDGSFFLESLNKEWEYLFESMREDEYPAIRMIADLFRYLDRAYITEQNNQLLEVFDLALKSFGETVIGNPQIKKHLKEILLYMISKERQHESIFWTDLKSVIKMLITIGIKNDRSYYEEYFEKPFMEASRSYYQKQAVKFLSQGSALEYIKEVNKCLEDEKQRGERYLEKFTEEKIMNIVKEELIAKHLIEVIEMPTTGLIFMLENDKFEDLESLYNLSKLVPSFLGIEVIIQKLSAYLRQVGNISINESTKPSNIIQSLLNLKSKFDKIVEQSFADSKEFKKCIQEDFTHIFKTEPDKSAQYLASYIDEKLKKSRNNNLTENEIEEHLNKAIILFRFLEDKDTFAIHYKQNLARRLLLEYSASIEFEISMISKLKADCGTDYAEKLNQMLADVAKKEELTQDFHQSPEFENCIDTSTLVLAEKVWPMTAKPLFELPRELQFASTKFSEYYKRIYADRRLTYLLPNCRGEVATTCFEKCYTFTATVPQIVILYQFNHETVQPFSQMCDQLKMKHDLARIALKPIIGAKILTVKHGKSSNNDAIFNDDAIFELNFDFVSKKFKINLTKKSAMAEPTKELEQVKKEIDDGRRFVVETAIVRIMKTRKVLRHSLLVDEVVNQLTQRFKPDGPLIKKVIESLINKDYLKRKEDEFDIIEYVA